MESYQMHTAESMSTFAAKAKHDTNVLKEILSPESVGQVCLAEKDVRVEYLKDPASWINSYGGHVTEFQEDDNYLDYVVGLLDVIVQSSPFSGDLYDIFTPIQLLNKIVTRQELMLRRDPMRTALRLQYRLGVYAKIEKIRNSIYDRDIEKLLEIPQDFALSLMNTCKTTHEVMNLMKIEDETMLMDVVKSQNAQLVACKIYQKLWWRQFYGYNLCLTSSDTQVNVFARILRAIAGLAYFLARNIFYPLFALYLRVLCSKQEREKHQKRFFSSYSSYRVDRLNQLILIALLWTTILITIPDLESTYNILQRLQLEDKITADNSSFFEVAEDGSVLVRLPKPKISPMEIALWVCMFGKALSGFYHAIQMRGSGSLLKRFKRYFRNFFYVADAVSLLLLFAGMATKLELFSRPRSEICGVYRGITAAGTGPRLDVPKSIELTTYLYCLGAVVALVNLLQIHTIYVPKLGPLIQIARGTFPASAWVFFLFAFSILGYIVPMMGVFKSYRSIHGLTESSKDFYYFTTFGNTVITLLWTSIGGLQTSDRNNLYRIDPNDVATFFMIVILLLYAIILSILCLYYLFVIMLQVYDKVHADKDAHWRFSQFASILEYDPHFTMPFLIPFCIPYIVYALVTKSVWSREKAYSEKDNHFAKFLCQHRIHHGREE